MREYFWPVLVAVAFVVMFFTGGSTAIWLFGGFMGELSENAWFFAVLFFLLWIFSGAYYLKKSLGTYRKYRLIQDTPTSKARSIATGRVELYGKALPYEKKRLHTPFGGVECIWCGWEIEVYNTSIPESRASCLFRYEGVIPGFFLLDDTTGKVLVYSKGADVETRFCKEYRRGLDSGIVEFLRKNGVKPPSTDNLISETYNVKAVERFIPTFEEVYVIGNAIQNPKNMGETENQEEGLIVTRGKDIFYIANRKVREVHEATNAGLLAYLLCGSTIVITGAIALFIYLGSI